MVSNIFSDKTGTLTANEMNFVQFVINGQMHHVKANSPIHDQLKLPGAKNSATYKFLRCLSACHTVIREKSGDYRAESPDELALIQGVGVFDCGLRERSTTQMNVELLNEIKAFDILAVNAFNSDRKRMSILVRDVENDEYFVFCKGADNIMIPLCKMDAAKTRSLDKSLRDLAVQGLRTLCIAEKKLDKAYVEKWLQDKKDAGNLMFGRAEKEAEVAAELELDMDLLGLTAIEDRLQDEVPEVIAELAEAGIVLWMLTGDKEETAENIGRSCNLVTENSKLVHITKIEGRRAYAKKLKSIYDLVVENYCDEGYIDEGKLADLVLVMDGPSFTHFDEFNSDHIKWFLKIGQSCRSVVACRLTPIQKQLVVRLVKENTFPKATTLSIGDGANDVSMIREADIGIGIYGKEGRHAANNADVAIGQFKFLRRLILVHGRWNYIRQSRVFLYCMHKNMVLTCSLFWYSYFTAVSGTSPYESYVYTGFNFMLGLPIIFYGIQDRDIPEEFALKYPQVYSTGKNNTFLTTKAIGMWIFNAVITAVIICVIGYYAMKLSFVDWSLFPFGTTVFVSLVMSLQLKIIYLNNQWDKVRFFIISISVLGTLLFIEGVSYSAADFYGVANQTYSKFLYIKMF
jgi:phospholipid-translocating P-type ATPase (flippase)